MERLRSGEDSAAVAGDVGVHPVLVDVAVEDFAPGAVAREADAVVEAIEWREMRDHDHVVARPFDPAMEGEHSVLIVSVDYSESLAAQARMFPAEVEQLASEPQVIEHLFVARIQAGPIEQ